MRSSIKGCIREPLFYIVTLWNAFSFGEPSYLGQAGRLTIHGDLDRQASDLADRVFHHTAVQVIILHEDSGDGEHLLVRGQEHSGVIEEGFAVLQPGVAGFGAILMGAVEGEGLAEFQHSG